MRLGDTEYINWTNQHAKEQLDFIRIHQTISDKEVNAYGIGIRAGWAAARATLVLQGFITMKPGNGTVVVA